MTKKEIQLLNLQDSPLNLDVEDELVTYHPLWVDIESKNNDDFYIQIGRARYYDFSEAQIMLNNLEKHIDRIYEN